MKSFIVSSVTNIICPHCRRNVQIKSLTDLNGDRQPKFIAGTRCPKCGKVLPYDIFDNIHHKRKEIY